MSIKQKLADAFAGLQEAYQEAEKNDKELARLQRIVDNYRDEKEESIAGERAEKCNSYCAICGCPHPQHGPGCPGREEIEADKLRLKLAEQGKEIDSLREALLNETDARIAAEERLKHELEKPQPTLEETGCECVACTCVRYLEAKKAMEGAVADFFLKVK